MQLATRFYCTRVKCTNVDDFRKLRWLMRYLWYTRYIPLIISIREDGEVCIYIDGAHAVHANGKEHSGLYVMIGKGAMINVLKKLGLVMNSSMETEVVSCGEQFSKCKWFRYFKIA